MTPQAHVADEGDIAVEGWADSGRGAVTWRTLLSADRTPSQALTLGVAETPACGAAEFRLHRHAQPEAYYVLSGRGMVHIDGAEFPLRPGSVAFIPGGAWHAARAVGSEPLRLLYVFAADSFAEIVYDFAEADGGQGSVSTRVESPSA